MKGLLDRLPPDLPEVALLLEPPLAIGLRVARGRAGAEVVARCEEALSWGAESGPSPESLRSLADRVHTALGAPQRLAVVLGDSLIKMQVLTLTDFPAKEEERQQVVRWHIRKTLNYSLDDLRLRYQVLEKTGGAVTLWLTLCSENLAQNLEQAFAASGCHVGFLGASSPELFNLAARRGALPGEGASLLLNRTAHSLSFLFSEGGVPRFFRCKDLRDDEEGQIAQEVRLTLAYHRDRIGGPPLAAVLVRRSSSALALPVEEEVADGVAVRTLLEQLPAPAGGAGRSESSLPLFSLLEA